MAACVFGETEFSLPRKEKRNRVFFNLCIENEAEVFKQKNGNRVFFCIKFFFLQTLIYLQFSGVHFCKG